MAEEFGVGSGSVALPPPMRTRADNYLSMITLAMITLGAILYGSNLFRHGL
jgi:hypothetical protein